MKKDKAKKFDIRKGHTLNEYFERFGKYYDKGEILSFTEEEKWLMDDHQIYWVIVGPDKVKRYYQLPSKLKRSRHLIRNHEKYHWPIISASLVALVGVMAAVSCYITGRYFIKPYIPPAPDPEWNEVMDQYMEKTEQGKNPEAAFKKMPIYDLANVAIFKFMKYDKNYLVEKPRKYLAVARGYTDTIVSIPPFIEGKVHVAVRNALVANDIGDNHNVKCMEESISFSEDMPDLVPRVGKREFYNELSPTFEVDSYTGDVSAPEQVKWLEKSKKVITDEEYYTKECPDKYPYDPFLYIVAKETMGEDEVKVRIDGKDVIYYTKMTPITTSEGEKHYVLDMNLNGTSSVERYARRMKYLSGKKPAVPFIFNHLQFEVDINCELVRSVVDEEFSIPADPAELIYFPSINHLETWYYHGDDTQVTIPEVKMNDMTRFPYENYLK